MVFMLETERLLIRPVKVSDLEPVYAYRNDPEVARYQGWDVPYPREKVVRWVNDPDRVVPAKPGDRLKAALEHKATGEMIGDAGFILSKDDARQARIWYTLARAHWHQGYATEALQRLLGLLFGELNLHRVTAETYVPNEPSWRLLERLGFRREAHLVESTWFKGAYESEYHYAMLKEEWEVIVTCDSDNVGSARVIEKNGGSTSAARFPSAPGSK
jgi:RimJ/RimL family protein N-acetyltransferase